MEWSEKEEYRGLFYGAGFVTASEKDWVVQDNSHIKDCLELIYCVSGEEEICINGKVFPFVPGMVRIIPPSTRINEDVKLRTLYASKFIVVGFITDNPFVRETVIVDARNNQMIYNHFEKLAKINENMGSNGFFEGASEFYLLIKELIGVMNLKTSILANSTKKLLPALEFIANHYCDKDLSLNDLPKMCGMKGNKFYDEFYKQYKVTPSAYVKNLKMQYAVELLLNDELSISEIAEKIGFESVTYFSRVFKQHFGKSPSAFKKQ